MLSTLTIDIRSAPGPSWKSYCYRMWKFFLCISLWGLEQSSGTNLQEGFFNTSLEYNCTASDGRRFSFTNQGGDLAVEIQKGNQSENTEEDDALQKNKGHLLDAGYTYISKMGFFKLHTDVETWNNARVICAKEGSYLAVPRSRAEVKVLVDMWNLLVTSTGAWRDLCAYIGLYKNDYTDTRTIFGEKTNIPVTSKYVGRNWGGSCACISSYKGNQPMNTDCTQALPFFCHTI